MSAVENAPMMAARLQDASLEKKMKKVIKEGGKKGVEIEGAADMGGLNFFCAKVEESEGDVDMIVETMKAMNAKSDPSEEERKGGSGHIGKTIVSHNDDRLAISCYVPKEKQGEIKANDWLTEIVALCEVGKPAIRADSNETYAQIEIAKDSEKNVFPLKVYPNVIQHGINILKKKGLFPDADSDDDDEMVFGDDDFDM